MAEHCWKCATPIAWNAGIGAFCPNPACDVLDALESGGAFEVRFLLDPVASPVARAEPATDPSVPRRELAPQG